MAEKKQVGSAPHLNVGKLLLPLDRVRVVWAKRQALRETVLCLKPTNGCSNETVNNVQRKPSREVRTRARKKEGKGVVDNIAYQRAHHLWYYCRPEVRLKNLAATVRVEPWRPACRSDSLSYSVLQKFQS